MEGIIMGRTQYLTQCNCYGILNPKLKKDAEKPPEWVWFDEPRIIVVRGKKSISLIDENKEKTGGPHSINEYPPYN